MQIGAIRQGDLVEVSWKQGEHLVAMVTKGAHEDATGRRVIALERDPLPGLARPMRLTATAREVVAHWKRRGSKKSAGEEAT